jgi:hypothetical protein
MTMKKFQVNNGLTLSGDLVDQETGEIINVQENDLIVNGKHIQAGFGTWLREDSAGSRQVGFDATTSTQLDFYVGGAVEASLTASGLTGLENLSLADNKYIYLGTGNDFRLYFSGTDTIFNAVAGQLYFQDNGATIAGFINTTFRMYDSRTFALGSGADWEFFHTGSDAFMDLNTGSWYWRDGANGSAIRMLWDADGGLRAYDDHYFALGTGNDFRMSFNGTDAIFNAVAGDLKIQDNGTDKFTFGTTDGDLTITGDLSADGTITASGHFDGPAEHSSTTSGTLAAGDMNTTISATGGITINNSIGSQGDIVIVYNNSAGNITITQGTGVTLRLAGTSDSGNRTIAQRGLACIYYHSASDVIVGGTGVT